MACIKSSFLEKTNEFLLLIFFFSKNTITTHNKRTMSWLYIRDSATTFNISEGNTGVDIFKNEQFLTVKFTKKDNNGLLRNAVIKLKTINIKAIPKDLIINP